MTIRAVIHRFVTRDRHMRPLELDANAPLCDVACPICDASDRLLQVCDMGRTASSLCLRCEHFFVSRRPSSQWFADFYAAEWFKGATHGSSKPSLKSRVADAVYTVIRKRPGLAATPKPISNFDFARPYLEQVRGVLEIGAGSGGYLEPFRKHGFRCFAIEPSDNSAAACAARGIKVVDRTIEEADPKRYSDVDFVYSNHSVEHHCDPNVFMRFAAQVLRPRQYLYLVVPNHYNQFFLGESLFLPHLQLFTERSLTRLGLKHGFRVADKQVDHQLRFILQQTAERDGAIPEPASEVCPQNAANYCAEWFCKSIVGTDGGELADGLYAVSFEPGVPPHKAWRGRYRVQCSSIADPNVELSPSIAPYRRTMVLEIRRDGQREPVVRFTGPDGGPAPILVK